MFLTFLVEGPGFEPGAFWLRITLKYMITMA